LEGAEEYVTYAQACKLLGTTRPVLRRRIEAGSLTVYTSGKDIRWRLLARRELAEMVRIKPLERGKETSGAVRVA